MPDTIDFHTLKFTIEKKFMTVTCTDGKKIQLDGTIGETVVGLGGFSTDLRNADHLELDWSSGGRLNVRHTEIDRRLRRYTFEWQSQKPKKMTDTWNMKGAHWYGGAAFAKMEYPLEKNHRKLLPFITGEAATDYSGVQERYFLSSKGVALFVEPDVPLYAGINKIVKKKDSFEFVLQADFSGAYENPNKQKLFLNYSLFQGPDIFKVHECAIKNVIDKPTDIPCEMMFRKPCWTTFGMLPANKLTKDKTLEFVNDLVNHDVPIASLEVAEHWAAHHGDFEFDSKRLPEPQDMFERIKDQDILTQVWIHPFAGNNSAAQKQKIGWVDSPMPNDYIKYQCGIGKLYDFTDENSRSAFLSMLETFKDECGMSSFRFDYGESTYLPGDIGLSDKNATCPNVYATKYAEVAAAADTEHRAQCIGVGVRTQHLPMFVRMRNRGSSWAELGTVIPHALTYSVIGFPFVLTDTAGGATAKGRLPDAELYTRWVQATCLMPGMLMAYPPHQFPDDTRAAVMAALELRSRMSDTLLQLARDSCNTGLPIVRPLWFLAPRDDNALTTDSQYMVGRDLIVAPVVEQGATSRNVYLPPGQWKDEVHDEVLVGGKWHYNVSAELGELLYFTRYPPPAPAAEEEPQPEPEEEEEEEVEEGDPEDSVAAKKLQREEDGEEDEEEEEEEEEDPPAAEEEEVEEEEEDEG